MAESIQDTFREVQESKIKRAIEWAEKMSKEASKEFRHDVYQKMLDYWLYFGEVRKR